MKKLIKARKWFVFWKMHLKMSSAIWQIATVSMCQAWQRSITLEKCLWVRTRNCGCLVTWFCYQLIAKPGNKTAAVSWPDPSSYSCFQFYVDPRNPNHAMLEARNLIQLADNDKDNKLSLKEVLGNMELFLGSKMVDIRRSFHDEF